MLPPKNSKTTCISLPEKQPTIEWREEQRESSIETKMLARELSRKGEGSNTFKKNSLLE